MTVAESALWEPWYRDKRFTEDWTSPRLPKWCRLFDGLRSQPLRILEIGSFEGRATVFFLNFFDRSHVTCIDVFALGNEPLFDFNVMSGADASRVTKIKAKSLIALDQLANTKQTFDVIYVDGSHDRDDVMMDSVLAWRVLKPGGVMIWDDYSLLIAMPKHFKSDQDPKPAIDTFMEWHRAEWRLIDAGYQMIVEKKLP